MARSSNPVRAKRINAALELLNEPLSLAEAAEKLAEAGGMSMRQAYRYLQAARSEHHPIAIPEQKIPFTVKLAPSLIAALREHAHHQRMTLGEVLQAAISDYLQVDDQSG